VGKLVNNNYKQSYVIFGFLSIIEIGTQKNLNANALVILKMRSTKQEQDNPIQSLGRSHKDLDKNLKAIKGFIIA
jgi:hypothetical protein